MDPLSTRCTSGAFGSCRGFTIRSHTGWTQVSVADHRGVDSVVSNVIMPGVSFGELSLMYGKPRTATVTCVKDGWLWCLERKAFRGILVDRMTHENTVKILRKVGDFHESER